MDYKKEIEKLFGSYLEENNLSIHDVKWIKDGAINFLQVDLDGEDNNLDKVTAATRYLNEQLDKNDPFPEQYILDVGTKGAEQELQTLAEALNKNVRLTFIDGRQETGELKMDRDEYVLHKMVKGKIKKINFHEVDVESIKIELKI